MSRCKLVHLSEGEVARIVQGAREDAIEECARVADLYAAPNYSGSTPEHIARRIRALKDKQP